MKPDTWDLIITNALCWGVIAAVVGFALLFSTVTLP
jgi:hypothetical protein